MPGTPSRCTQWCNITQRPQAGLVFHFSLLVSFLFPFVFLALPFSNHVFAEAQPSEDKIPEVYNINHNTSDIAGLRAFVQDKQHAGRMTVAAAAAAAAASHIAAPVHSISHRNYKASICGNWPPFHRNALVLLPIVKISINWLIVTPFPLISPSHCNIHYLTQTVQQSCSALSSYITTPVTLWPCTPTRRDVVSKGRCNVCRACHCLLAAVCTVSMAVTFLTPSAQRCTALRLTKPVQ